MLRATAVLIVLSIVSGAVAQTRPVQWISNPGDAVKLAKRTQKPLLFFVPGEDLGDLEDQQQVVLRDPLVRELIGDRFVGARLTRSTNNAELFTKWNAPTKYGQYMLVVTPGGDLVGMIGAEVVARKDAFLGALTNHFRSYRSSLFEKELLPEFKREKLNRNNVSKALGYIKAFIITDADNALVEFLGRELDDGTRKRVYETLAELSTDAAITALAKAAETDPVAATAMKKVTPAAAAQLATSALIVNGEVRVHVYDAITSAAKIRDAKPARFWETADEGPKQEEIKRVSELVKEEAAKWNARWGSIR